uniref:Uncharacterized protein n=1 Tax=Panagrolaimus sp. ES5 TaxID=591445 RepID=A0AC34GUN0_9BILA
MWLSDCSDFSDLSTGEILYSLDELQRNGVIDSEVADFLKDNPLPPDDPILLLQYDNPNIVNRENEIYGFLAANGGVPVNSRTFKFATKDLVYLARERMRNSHTWVFYDPLGSAVPGYLLNRPEQYIPLPQAVTISTKLIHFYSDSKFTVDEEYKFFMW